MALRTGALATLSSKDVDLLFDAKPTQGFGTLNVNWKLGVVESHPEMYVTLLLSRVLKVEIVHIKLRQPFNLQQDWAPLVAKMDQLSEFRLWSAQYSTYVYIWRNSDSEGVKGNDGRSYDVLELENYLTYGGYVGDEAEWRGLECNGTKYMHQKNPIGSDFEYRERNRVALSNFTYHENI